MIIWQKEDTMTWDLTAEVSQTPLVYVSTKKCPFAKICPLFRADNRGDEEEYPEPNALAHVDSWTKDGYMS